MARVVLSIRPRFAEKILSGKKRYEFRRALFCRREVSSVLIYASAPLSRVIGEFKVAGYISTTPAALWAQTKDHAGIDKAQFDQYFSGKQQAHALKIENPRRFKIALDLKKDLGISRPPQSFCYVES